MANQFQYQAIHQLGLVERPNSVFAAIQIVTLT
jgi:hypothetical protein